MTAHLATIFDALQNEPRLLLEAELKPVQGNRFQPTGFPDLGAALYLRPDGTEMLLIESAQSMANRLESVCWDDAVDKIAAPLAGLPHVVVNFDNGQHTSSLQEAHRLNSGYIMDNSDLGKQITQDIGAADAGIVDIRKVAKAVFSRDPNSLLHGVFFARKEIVQGRARLQRLLSSFIEAENVMTATSGGAKIDRMSPKGAEGQSSESGYGNIIYTRTEYTAAKITAYFNLDLATMRGYGLGDAANRLLIALALYKITQLLQGGLRLRTACDLEAEKATVTRPKNLQIEDLASLRDEVTKALPALIAACEFGADAITQVQATIAPKKAKGKKEEEVASSAATTDENDNEDKGA
jgi:CRISPR-associated protein Csb1